MIASAKSICSMSLIVLENTGIVSSFVCYDLYFIVVQVLRAMRESDCPRPAIFAMSNPTSNGLSSFEAVEPLPSPLSYFSSLYYT